MPKSEKGLKSRAQLATTAFYNAEDELNTFLKNPDIREVFLEFEELVNNRNLCLDEAMRAIKAELKTSQRDKLIVDGLGAQKKYKRYYDAEYLVANLPAMQSDQVLTERIVYDVNVEQLEVLARRGEIDSDIVKKAYHEDEMSPANLPGTPKAFAIPAIPTSLDE